MAISKQREFWLRGPVEGIPALLQPVAHALLQASAEIKQAMEGFPKEGLWQRPAGAASIAFHLQHITGVLDRLFTYARGEQLNEQQLVYLAAEGRDDEKTDPSGLMASLSNQIDRALEQLANTNETSLLEARAVGRQLIPSNVLGLLFHAAEHTQRHTGQLLVTARVVRQRDH